MNCDRLAPHYSRVEFAAFGARLERHRFRFLERLASARRVLILGEGDGRFLARFLASNACAEIDCLDLSSRMLEIASARIAWRRDRARVRFIHADARQLDFEKGRYDLVVANFFFDCFDGAELATLIARIASASRPHADWLVSEFHQPASGWRARHAALWLTTMYAFFRVATGLRVARLPAYAGLLQNAGFDLIASEHSLCGLVGSELWSRTV